MSVVMLVVANSGVGGIDGCSDGGAAFTMVELSDVCAFAGIKS